MLTMTRSQCCVSLFLKYIISLVEKKLRFCLCIFESDTVKSDCPVQIFRKMMKYLFKDYVTSFTVFLEIFKKKKEKKTMKKKL